MGAEEKEGTEASPRRHEVTEEVSFDALCGSVPPRLYSRALGLLAFFIPSTRAFLVRIQRTASLGGLAGNGGCSCATETGGPVR